MFASWMSNLYSSFGRWILVIPFYRGLEECSNLLRSKWWQAVELDLNYKLLGPKAHVLFPSPKGKEAALAASPRGCGGRLWPLPPPASPLYHGFFLQEPLSGLWWFRRTGSFLLEFSQLLLLSPLVHTDYLFLVYSSKPFSKLPCLWPRLQTPSSEKESDRLCWLNNRCSHFSQDEIVVFNKPPFLPFFLCLSLSFPPSHSTLKQQHFSHFSGSLFCHCWPREQKERE